MKRESHQSPHTHNSIDRYHIIYAWIEIWISDFVLIHLKDGFLITKLLEEKKITSNQSLYNTALCLSILIWLWLYTTFICYRCSYVAHNLYIPLFQWSAAAVFWE